MNTSILDKGKLNNEIPAIDKNIAAVHNFRKASDENRRADQRFVDHVATFLGTTKSLYLHLAVYGIWIALHLYDATGLIAHFTKVEYISTVASLDALFLAVFVLINQRRMNQLERKNADLHLQVSLLAEYELTKLVQIADLTSAHLGVRIASVTGLKDIKKDLGPDEILSRIIEHEKRIPTPSTSGERE